MPATTIATATALLLALPLRGDDPLKPMREAVAKLKTVHALVRADDHPDATTTRSRFLECWIDVEHGRLRVETRDFGRASPHLLAVADGGSMRFQQLETGEIAEQVGHFRLETLLSATLAGELLSTAFHGDLVSFKPEAYGKPTVSPEGEAAGGTGCTKLTFPGNRPAELWIGDGDRFPRKISGPLPKGTLEETIALLEVDRGLGSVSFEIPAPEGHKLLEPRAALKSWSRLPPESGRWPKTESDAPDFAALDLDAKTRIFTETAETEVVLAFWTAEDPKSVDAAALLDRHRRDSAKPLRLIHLAAGADYAPTKAAADGRGLTSEVWVAGRHEQNAFRQFRVWSCPVFFRVRDLWITGVTADPAEAQKWFDE